MNGLIHLLAIEKKYKIIKTFTVSRFLENTIVELGTEFKPLYKPAYNNNERIVLIDDVANDIDKQPFYDYLQRLLIHLDITNCFVLIVGDATTQQLVKNSHSKYVAHDLTTFEFIEFDVVRYPIKQVTDFSLPESVCVNPWINIELSTVGALRPCCNYDWQESNVFPNIENLSIGIAVNDNSFKHLRKQMKAGVLVSGCKKCWADEQAGNQSKRQRDNYVFKDKLFEIDWNQTDAQLASLDLKLKNLCNLSCRICGPYASSKWYDEASKNPEIYQNINLKIVKSDWRTDAFDEKVWRDFTKSLEGINYVTFAGGEPLLDKPHISLLQSFIDKKKSKGINLHYNTNGTIYAEHLISVWNNFNLVELSFSIDNTEEKFEYERYGSNWNNVIENINNYQKLDSALYKFNIFATISMLNILEDRKSVV